MSEPRKGPGLLVAIDGTRGADVREAAADVLRRLRAARRPGGVTTWDASGVFTELKAAKRRHRQLSPRTLVLLYAADLAFRLRWAIRPAIAEGQVVIAAPYTTTAIAFGVAAGLPRSWLDELFRFAPAPGVAFSVKEPKRTSGWTGKSVGGLAEFCATTLHGELGNPATTGLRVKMLDYLNAVERRKHTVRVTRKRITSLLD